METEKTFSQMLPLESYLQGKKYRIDRYISSGGFGNTYEVMNVEFEERMALKEFFMKGISEREDDSTTVSVSNSLNQSTFNSQKEKFKKEARRLRKLHNPYIVQVHDLFEENGTAYYAMDFIDGESLSARLKRTRKPLSEAEAMSILRQVLEALESVHSQGLWHLDLKPGNIMIDREGHVKLIDFGASKQMSGTDGYTTTSSAMCYTPGYAPPEQIDQKMDLIGPWTDLYALGGTLYNLLTTNQPPTVSEMQEDDAFTFPQGVSDKTKYLVRWMMTPRRQKRPQSVADVKAFLEKPFVKPQKTQGEETVLVEKENPSKKGDSSEKTSRKTEKKSDTNHRLSKRSVTAGILAAVFLVGIIAIFVWKSSGNEASNPDITTTDSLLASQETIIPTPEVVSDMNCNNETLGEYKYTGPVDSEGLPHGRGEAMFTDNRYYKGPFIHGVFEGDSVYFRFENDDIFEGSFKANRFCEGTYTIKEDGSYFKGFFKDGGPDENRGSWYDKNGKKI